MALTFPLTIPSSPGWVKKSLALVHNRSTHRSPLNGSQQVLLRAGSFWAFHGELPPMTQVQARPWLAFLAGMEGGAGTFQLPVPDYSGPANGSADNGLINGASQTGKALICDNHLASQTPLLAAGEYLQVENQLYMAVEDGGTDGLGNVTYSVVPEIRVSPLDNAVVEVLAPKVLMRPIMARTGWETDHRGLFHITIAAEEVVT